MWETIGRVFITACVWIVCSLPLTLMIIAFPDGVPNTTLGIAGVCNLFIGVILAGLLTASIWADA